jgi:hypothetical protein
MNSLAFVRTHLAMDIAYVSEFVGDEIVFRAVSAPGFEDSIAVGGTRPLKSGYCHHIVAGRLPELIPDTANEPLTQTIPVTHDLSDPQLRQCPDTAHRRHGLWDVLQPRQSPASLAELS